MRNKVSFDINSVPKDWSIIPCGVFFREKSIKNTKGEMNLSVYRDYGVIPTDSRNDNHNKVSEDTSNYKLVNPGNFVLNKMKGWSGSLGVSNYRGIVSPSYTVLEQCFALLLTNVSMLDRKRHVLIKPRHVGICFKKTFLHEEKN